MTDSADGLTPDDDAAAARVIRLFLVAMAAVIVGVLVLSITVLVRSGDDGDQPDAGSERSPDVSRPDAGPIGPNRGDDVVAYVADRRVALEGADGDVAALVSLAAYLDEPAARELVDGMDVGPMLVALPGGVADRVDGDIGLWVDDQLATAQADRDAIAALIPTIDDPEFLSFYEDELVRFDAMLAAGDTRAIVFAVAVRADAAELRTLAANPAVRLVDVGATDDFDIALRGLRPEETALAGDPELRPFT